MRVLRFSRSRDDNRAGILHRLHYSTFRIHHSKHYYVERKFRIRNRIGVHRRICSSNEFVRNPLSRTVRPFSLYSTLHQCYRVTSQSASVRRIRAVDWFFSLCLWLHFDPSKYYTRNFECFASILYVWMNVRIFRSVHCRYGIFSLWWLCLCTGFGWAVCYQIGKHDATDGRIDNIFFQSTKSAAEPDLIGMMMPIGGVCTPQANRIDSIATTTSTTIVSTHNAGICVCVCVCGCHVLENQTHSESAIVHTLDW